MFTIVGKIKGNYTYRNLKRARATWRRVSKILTQEEDSAPVAGIYYNSVVVAVLLYGSKPGYCPPLSPKAPDGFHVEAAQQMTDMRPKRWTVGPWIYPKSKDVMTMARLKPVATYICQRRNTIVQTISRAGPYLRSVGGQKGG